MESDVLEQMLMSWGVVALCVLLALWLALPLLRRWRARRRLERAIVADGIEQMRDVLLDNGMGGQAFFEWLLLTPEGIRVVMTSGREGIIFAGERMDSWAQVVGKRTTHFPNPLYSLEESLSALRFHLPKQHVEANLLFIGNCSFPKGRPSSVLTPAELEQGGPVTSEREASPLLGEAWKKLQGMVRKVDPATEGYLLPIQEESPRWRWLLIVMLLIVAGVWLYWRELGI